MDERLMNQNIQTDAGNAQKRRDQRAVQRDEGLIPSSIYKQSMMLTFEFSLAFQIPSVRNHYF